MGNRLLKESINESRGLAEVSIFAEDLYKRLITYADDFGRFSVDYQIMRARLYPREIEIVSNLDIEDALIDLSGARKVSFYTAQPRRKIYGCFPNWGQHQRLRDSKKKLPDPTDTDVNDWYIQRFIPLELKKRIIERDGFKCSVCGKYVTAIDNSYELVKKGAGLYRIDFITPASNGGKAAENNLRLVCPKCSNRSQNRRYTADEILDEMAEKKQNPPQLAETCGNLRQLSATCENFPPESESNTNTKKNKNTMCTEAGALFEKLWALYPVKKGKGQVSDAKKRKILEIGYEEMARAISRYRDYVDSTDYLHYQYGSTFFNSGYVDYLDANYTQDTPKRQAGNLHNFHERDNDYDKLQSQLLRQQMED